MDSTYRLRFQAGEVEFEIESTDLKWLEKKEGEYLSRIVKEDIFKPLKEGKSSKADIRPGITINEFYRQFVQKTVKGRPNVAVMLIYYLEVIAKKAGTIKRSEVKDAFGDISFPNYNNINFTDVLNSAKRKGHLNLVNKLWSLTSTGKDFALSIITEQTK